MTEEHRVQFIHENSWCGEGSRTKTKTKCCVTERKRARATWARVEFTGNVPVLSMDKKEVDQSFLEPVLQWQSSGMVVTETF